MKTLTVTEAARNLSECVKRVYRRHESFELTHNGIAHARLVPPKDAVCNSHELAEDLAARPPRLADRRSLRNAIRKGRRYLKPVKNPWA